MRRIFLMGLLLLAGAAWAAPAGKIRNKGNFGVAGWLVYWNPKSMATFEKQAALIDRVYPEWYTVGKDGLPSDNVNNTKSPEERQAFLANKRRTVEIARKNGIQIFSMIVNFDNERFEHSSARVHQFLYNPALRKRHIQALIANAVRDGADGIDIDYENLTAKDAAPFAAFIKDLKAECRRKNLLLAAALAPKMSDAGTWDGNQAHDYRELGKHLDLIRPMTYDEHWATSAAGPVSSPEFTEMVDRYAAGVAGAGKVELGIAAYGYDWKGKQGKSLPYDDYVALVKRLKITPSRDPETKEITFKYMDGADSREVWFCDAGSYRPKYDIIRKHGLAGLAMWYIGSEDPAFWEDVKQFKYAKNWSK